MSVASQFRANMDAALNSADASKGDTADARRTAMLKDLSAAGLMIISREMIGALMKDAANRGDANAL